MLPLITALLPIVSDVIDRVIPDKEAAAKAKLEMQASMMANEHAITLAQLEINREEAKSDNIFVSGWRPAVGWLGVLALLWVYIIHPLLAWASINLGWQAPPEVDTTVILQILTGLLGFGALRTFEKTKGVARESLKKKLTMEPIE
tara:strand:- start:469 stop:906 length:438 start_codon:yes stop_codon:yes gene_type:complete